MADRPNIEDIEHAGKRLSEGDIIVIIDDWHEIKRYITALEAENAALRTDNQNLRGWSEALENLIRAAKDEYDKNPD